MAIVPRTTARDSGVRPAFRSWLSRVIHQIYQPGLLLPTALTMALIVLWPYLPAWSPDLSADPAYQLTPERLQLSETHRWIPENFADRTLQRAGEQLKQPLSLLTEGLSERIAHALTADPWVKSVVKVEQRRDGTILAQVELRHPALMVSTTRGMYAVDVEGVLLPPEDFRAEDIREFPLVRGVQSLPHTGIGKQWDDPAVQGAARLAKVLMPEGTPTDPWQALQLAAILVPSSSTGANGSQLTYELLTTGGSRIVWGHAPGGDSWEPPADQKIARLLYYREQTGGFETAQGPSRIDIRDIDVIYAGAIEAERR